MGFFSASPVESDVEKATSEKNTSEDWSLILDVCDKAAKSPEEAKNYFRAILKRLNNPDPHVSLQAATLLDACVNNSGKVFRIEVASREFENEYLKLINKSHEKVIQKLKELLKKWAEGEFKNDQQLNLIPSLYSKLKNKGFDFSAETPAKKTVTLSKDPNVVQSQEEEDQIVKAIELSLKETSGSPRMSGNSSLYPAANLSAAAGVGSINATPAKEPRKVRALYDFEAAEDNELTFNSGEIIFVLDDSDPNWWKGSNQRGEGLFPANFVTADLSVEPEQFLYEKAKKIVQFKETVDVKPVEKESEDVEINEERIDRLLHLLHEADPTNPEQDTDEMLSLEREVNCMGPLIDTELERVDRKHAQLTQLSSDLVEALGLYHTLMREPQLPPINKIPYTYSPTQPPSMAYNGNIPHSMGPVSLISGPSSFMHQTGGPSQSLPPQFRMQRMNVPPGHMAAPGPGHPQHIMPPASSVPSLPPGLQHNPHQEDGRLHHEQMSGQFSMPGVPNYGPTSIPPGFPLNGPVVSQTGLQQNGPHHPGPYTSNSNTHIM